MPWLLFAALLAGGAFGGTAKAAAEPAPSASGDQTALVKYYIVGSTGTAERDYLFQIAARTLGDGRRYMEIFELNKGRPQPDGGRLEDPLVLTPGWILVLPADAEGPGVMFGPLHLDSAQATPTRGTTATPISAGDGAIRTVALIAVAAILGLALHLLRRGRRIELPEPARAALRMRVDSLPTAQLSTRRPRAHPTEDFRAVEEPAPPAATAPRAEPAPRVTPRADAAPMGRAELHDGYGGPYGRNPAAAAPAAAVDPTTARVQTSLRAGRDVMSVSLVGARAGAGSALVGRGDAGPPRTGDAVVRLGEPGPDALWVNLAASPDVITITGARGGVRRQSEEFARQLARAGVPTVAVGAVPGVADHTSRTVASLRELTNGSDPAHLLVVFLDQVSPGDVAALHKLISRRRPRVVAVAVGSGPRSRWSIDVT